MELPPVATSTLHPPPNAPSRPLLAVPSARPVAALTTALGLAQDLEWPLLVLCSHEVKATQVRERVVTEGWQVDLVAVDVTPHWSLRGHRGWRASRHWAAHQRLDVDTERKRNLAVAAGRMCGLDMLLFLDDDVRGLTAAAVSEAARLLAHAGSDGPDHRGPAPETSRDRVDPTMVGWASVTYPDNSVVCHARREFTDLPQSTFIGGNALLVDLRRAVEDFFPSVYNEDWLFLYESLSRREVAAGSDVGQQGYDPYADPLRARWQEFGDVLGEGLFHLLHERASVDVATAPDYWRPVRAHRRLLLDHVSDQLRHPSVRARTDPLLRQNALHAMAEARSQLTRATPESLADFVVRWQADRRTWQEFLAALPSREAPADAVTYLGIPPWDLVTRPL